jgi:hypothetical protein
LSETSQRYYRVVDDQPRDGRPPEESTLHRWMRGAFNSTNEGAPPEWIIAWDSGRRRGRFFPRSCKMGRSSARAKKLFLHIAKRYGVDSQEMAAAKYRVGEQDGVHCCETPPDIWKYMAGTIEGNFVVEFTGEKLDGQTIAESYGVQVRNVTPLGQPIPAEEFGLMHGLPMPDAPLPFIDSAEYED